MKLKEYFKEHAKDYVYDKYARIVFKTKDYNSITVNKMISEIIKEYHQKNFLFNICTEKELNVLKKLEIIN